MLISCFSNKNSPITESSTEDERFARPSSHNKFPTLPPIVTKIPNYPDQLYKTMSGTIKRVYFDNEENTDGTPYTFIESKGQTFNIKMEDRFQYIETGDVVKVHYIFTPFVNSPDNLQTLKVIKLALLSRPESTTTSTRAFPSTTWPKDQGPQRILKSANLEKKKIKMLGVIVNTNISGTEQPQKTEKFLELLNFFKENIPNATFNRYEVTEVKVANVQITDDTEDSRGSERENKAGELLLKQNINVLDYDHIVYLGRTFRGLNWGVVGSPENPGRSISISTLGDFTKDELSKSKFRVLFHEWGHNVGMLHSNTWAPNLTSYYQERREYLDLSSVMGNYHCLKLNFLSFNSANVASHFLGDDHPYVKEVESTQKFQIQVLNTTQSNSALRILKFQDSVTNKENQNVLNPFYISLVRQCSLSGRGAHNVLIHQKAGKETYIVAELKPGESVKILNHEILYDSLSKDFIATITVKN